MKEKIEISVVSPVYMGEKMVSELVRRNVEVLTQMRLDYEIILVNDASPDESWREIEKECKKNPKVKGLDLSRNFGQHNAITAGLSYAKGEWVVVMDCDLQDRPEEIPNLYAKAQEGYDVVVARRVNRKDGQLKRMSGKVHRAVFDWLSGMKSDPAIGNYGIYNRKVIAEINKMPEVARDFEVLLYQVGFSRATIDVEHAERAEGHSSYNLRKLLKLSFDIIISNTNKPLRMAVATGFFMSMVSFILALYNVLANVIGMITVEGYTTTVFSIWFVGGLLLFVMGILGLYIGKIYDQVKGRQLFIVRKSLNFDNQ